MSLIKGKTPKTKDQIHSFHQPPVWRFQTWISSQLWSWLSVSEAPPALAFVAALSGVMLTPRSHCSPGVQQGQSRAPQPSLPCPATVPQARAPMGPCPGQGSACPCSQGDGWGPELGLPQCPWLPRSCLGLAGMAVTMAARVVSYLGLKQSYHSHVWADAEQGWCSLYILTGMEIWFYYLSDQLSVTCELTNVLVLQCS